MRDEHGGRLYGVGGFGLGTIGDQGGIASFVAEVGSFHEGSFQALRSGSGRYDCAFVNYIAAKIEEDRDYVGIPIGCCIVDGIALQSIRNLKGCSDR